VAVKQTYCDAGASVRAFHLTAAELPTGKKTMFGSDETKLEEAGPLGAFVCAACGYTEWYMPAAALSLLERMIGTGAVSVVQNEVERDPFR
jgi:hypothetical protein